MAAGVVWLGVIALVVVLCRAAAIPVEATLRLEVLTVGGEAIVRGRGRPQPEQVVETIELDLGTITMLGLGQKDQHAKFELHLVVEPAAVRTPAGRIEITVPAAEADVVGPALEQ